MKGLAGGFFSFQSKQNVELRYASFRESLARVSFEMNYSRGTVASESRNGTKDFVSKADMEKKWLKEQR